MQGHWSGKQFIKNKPISTGVKYYMLCDPETGYCFNLMIHNGNEQYAYEDLLGKRFGLTWTMLSGYNVDGSKSYLDQGHVIYTDKYYTSIELLYQLLNRNTYAVGRFMRNKIC